MAERLEVSAVWLSRYLELARLPDEVVAAFPTKRDLREIHARTLKPLLKSAEGKARVLAAALELTKRQAAARDGQGAFVDAAVVLRTLKAATTAPAKKYVARKEYGTQSAKISVARKAKALHVEIPVTMDKGEAEAALKKMLDSEF